ncbi:hypothetical protein LJB83_02430 [Clostridia bacterium OttesenSCG-928-F22]|nr:hypothetical protein [Clostridia bacterium OttesenSCG-928-F22]
MENDTARGKKLGILAAQVRDESADNIRPRNKKRALPAAVLWQRKTIQRGV